MKRFEKTLYVELVRSSLRARMVPAMSSEKFRTRIFSYYHDAKNLRMKRYWSLMLLQKILSSKDNIHSNKTNIFDHCDATKYFMSSKDTKIIACQRYSFLTMYQIFVVLKWCYKLEEGNDHTELVSICRSHMSIIITWRFYRFWISIYRFLL